VLRVIEVMNTSVIVVWLTGEHGRRATMIKGAFRPKSMFFGRFDLFYTCELLFYSNARSHLHTARECSPLKTRSTFRVDWRACAAASYCCDLIEKITPWGTPHPELFSLLDAKLDDLAMNGATAASLFWFELRLMMLLGWTPRLNSCSSCGNALKQRGRDEIFSNEHGGLLCKSCTAVSRESGRPVSPSAIAMLRCWQQAEDSKVAGRTRCSPAQTGEICALLGRFMRYHLDTELRSREIAFEIITE